MKVSAISSNAYALAAAGYLQVKAEFATRGDIIQLSYAIARLESELATLKNSNTKKDMQIQYLVQEVECGLKTVACLTETTEYQQWGLIGSSICWRRLTASRQRLATWTYISSRISRPKMRPSRVEMWRSQPWRIQRNAAPRPPSTSRRSLIPVMSLALTQPTSAQLPSLPTRTQTSPSAACFTSPRCSSFIRSRASHRPALHTPVCSSRRKVGESYIAAVTAASSHCCCPHGLHAKDGRKTAAHPSAPGCRGHGSDHR
ncbi:hypothetical protein C8R43DRAFT_1018054 [Mycena crocata]|nr:hypothetical protein C8R43DRAFT_1018054 [Mycena crocata]